jgi:hypothetical protein
MADLDFKRFRVLAVVHIFVGLLLLPLSAAFGLILTPIVALGPLWIVILGVLLWRPTVRKGILLRWTHIVGVVVAALLCTHGILALRAAERSSAEGGGLMGAYGLIPVAFGVLLGATSAASLWLLRTQRSGERC